VHHARELIRLFLSVLLIFLSGVTAKIVFVGRSAAATPSNNAKVWGYDPAKGTEETDIRKNFNLHRGRWWNYYERGSWYLAYGHYKAAKDDFRVVVKKRPTDKRNCRTYGMHFRDCFAHRELGIILYYQAIQVETKADRISLLDESVAELNKSLNQAESSRAAFFLNLAKESQWEAKEEVDTTAPAITVENAIRAGENWALVFCNQRTVQLDIRVTDDQSGVDAAWVNEERLFVERSAWTIPQTVHVPVGIDSPWIPVRARDLAGNDSPPILVKVEMDMRPPIIFTTAHPERMTPDGLVPVRYSARDDLGLSTIQMDDQKIDCNGRLECGIVVQVKAEPGRSRVEVRATDLAGNTTKGFVDLLPGDRQADERMNGPGPLVRPARLNQRLITYPQIQAPRAFFLEEAFRSPISPVVYASQNAYLRAWLTYATLAAEVTGAADLCSPVFVFDESEYRRLPGGYPVPSDRYVVEGKLDFAIGVKEIRVGDSSIPIDPNSKSVVFSECINLPDYGTKEIHVEAHCVNGYVVEHREPFEVKRIPNPTAEPNSVYSVVVLPLEQAPTPWDFEGRLATSELRYDCIKRAVTDCNLYDLNSGEPLRRFNCSAMRDLDLDRIETVMNKLGLGECRDEHHKASMLGGTYGVDLCIFGDVEDYRTHYQITLWVVDIESGERLLNSPIGTYVAKDESGSIENALKAQLETAIPRVSGRIIGITRDKPETIRLNRGQDDRLYYGGRLWVFSKKGRRPGNIPDRLVEATVKVLDADRSVAEIVESDNKENLFDDVEIGQMFITK
jgi:hypothetical protein